MKFPKIRGIVLIDKNYNICDQNGKSVADYLSESVRQLDSNVFNRYFNKWASNSILALGEMTQHRMASLTHSLDIDIIVSNKTELYSKLDSTVYTFDDDIPGTEHLLHMTVSNAIKTGKDILVLGGRSVYESFNDHYDEFVVCQYKEQAFEGEGKNIDNVSIPDPSEAGSTMDVVFDSTLYRVSIFRKEEV